MLEFIKFRKTEFYSEYLFKKQKGKKIDNLSKINLFIGPNNTGKSRFLRKLFQNLISAQLNLNETSYKQISTNQISVYTFPKKELKPIIDKLRIDFNSILENSVDKTRESLEKFLSEDQLKNLNENINEIDFIKLIYNFNQYFDYVLEIDRNRLDAIFITDNTRDKLEEAFFNFNKSLEYFFPEDIKSNSVITFVPPFRTLKKFIKVLEKTDEVSKYFSNSPEGFKYINEPILKQKFLHDYFDILLINNQTATSNKIGLSNIDTGEDFYERISALRNSRESDRVKLESFENFLSKNFFKNKKVEINAIKENKRKEIFLKVGDEREFPIYNLGDGIQSIIILIFSIFENQDKKHFLFYEEPEIYLHPGFQRIFLDSLNQIQNLQVFISTHSNHFLDLSINSVDNISIYSFQKNTSSVFEIQNISSKSNQLLNTLGVRNSSVYLSNCTIWVEGVSDEIYIRKYLELYFNKEKNYDYKEDIHYSFVGYNGNNLSHWNFDASTETTQLRNAFSLSNKIFLLSDKDSNKEKKHAFFRKILKATLEKYSLSKSESLEFNSFTYKDYKSEPIGEFIFKVIGKEKIKKIASTPKEGQTGKLYNKMDFAKSACANIDNWKDLSNEAKSLTTQIADFIKRSN